MSRFSDKQSQLERAMLILAHGEEASIADAFLSSAAGTPDKFRVATNSGVVDDRRAIAAASYIEEAMKAEWAAIVSRATQLAASDVIAALNLKVTIDG